MTGAEPSVRVAHMHPAHVEQVVRIERRSFGHPWSPEIFQGQIAHPCGVPLAALAWPSGVVLGYLVMWIDHGSRVVQVQNLAVDTTHRRAGVASLLLRTGLGHAAAGGARRATLEVRRCNIAAITLYESLGFNRVGVSPGYYEAENEDAILMALPLPPRPAPGAQKH